MVIAGVSMVRNTLRVFSFLAVRVAAQPGQDSLPDNICEDVKVYDYAQKKCVDPGTGTPTGSAGTGDIRPSWRMNGFIEELACDCAERDCSCGRKCDCKPPKQKLAPGGDG